MAGPAPLLLLVLSACAAFNLDPSVSVVKTGTPRSLFGFSVALHQDLGSGAFRLLVGAPRETAEPGVLANRTGGVYVCPITPEPSECTRLPLTDSEQLLPEDLIEDMWLGVSVVSQGPPGGRVLMCGHRFVRLYGAYRLHHMTGHCYVRGNDLQYNDSDAHWQNPDQVCSHLGDLSTEVMCTMGISAAISQTEIIVGSPGSFDWQGNVHVLWMNPDVMFDTKRNSFRNMEQRNIYMGYSVALAPRLLSQQVDSIITGAPKDSKHDARGSVFLALRSDETLQIVQRLRGQQMGSYYGNAIAAVDLNNDGWSDLLVGAPFFFHRQQEVGGAVYLYLNTGGRFDSRPSHVLTGPQHSAFGMALCAAGDLDQDGFQDFVVGAPFHGSGSVMVFNSGPEGVSSRPSQVIQGSSVSPVFRTFGFSLAPAHDVDQNHHPDLLIGSLDDSVVLLRSRPVVELNQSLHVTPDLVEPSDCEHCIQVKVCFSYRYRAGGSSDKDNITVQFVLSADVTSLTPRVRFSRNGRSQVWSHLSMPSAHCSTLRAGLQFPVRDQVHPLVFSLNASLVQKLPKKRNGLQDLRRFPVSSRSLAPARAQIHIQKACGTDNRCHSNLQMTAHFTNDKHTPLDTVAGGHQLLLLDSSLNLLLLHVNVTNLPSPWKPQNHTHNASSPWRPLDNTHNTMSPFRLAEDAHNVALNISIPASLTYSGVRSTGATPSVKCSVEGDVLVCELGNPLKANHQVDVWIRFQPSEASLRSRQIHSRLQLSTLSEQWDLFPVTVSMLVEVSLQTSLTLLSAPGPVYFSGRVLGESAVSQTSDIGSAVTFVFQVHTSGRPLRHLGNLMLTFDWPLELWNGKWLLYLSQIQIQGTSATECSPSAAIDALRLTVSDGEDLRRRRTLEESLEQTQTSSFITTLPLHSPQRRAHSLSCELGARCVRVQCPLLHMNNTATVTVRSRLWNSTLLEEFVEASSVTIKGRATLQLQTDTTAVNMREQSVQVRSTLTSVTSRKS